MQKSVWISFFILLIANSTYAQNFPINEKLNNSTLSIQPKVGYSISKTTFNISGNELGKNPNILSELIWDPTNALEFGLEMKLSHKKFVLNGEILLNKNLSGNVTDFDYDGDNRTQPYTQLYLSNHKGTGLSIKVQPGIDWSTQENLSFVTYLSFNHTSRSLYLLNDKNRRSNDRNYLPGLNSYYKYKFPNYGVGMAMDYGINENWSTQIAVEGYISKYYAYGNWNLIEDFEKPISYEHKGNGQKFFATAGFAYALSPNLGIGMQYSFGHFNLQNGKDYLYTYSEGTKRTRLNDANETKHSFLLNLRYSLPFGN
ncbi:hypothetical protein [Sphingobacterium composti Ten et al. 2007 non Yoo et al. 2007]|uniref:hypothetical protein n=1 Tax=Sphingobacterium composti TaxID=363260 RepID=UPI0013582D9D|nr:hypothetical protein [Sphingobacterium composti Ten et al. 2007 non Yoo et al. 2007]